jgi:hypothetical protein
MPSLENEALRAHLALFNHTCFAIPRRPLKVALYVYLDESGKFHDGTGFICLCGYMGEDAQLVKFNRRWARLLKDSGLSSLHTTKFPSECKKLGLDETEADKLLTKFIDIIRESELFGFAVGVDGKYFKQKLKLAGRPKADPALFAIHRILREMREACAQVHNHQPRIMLTFDEAEDYAITTYKLVSRLRKANPEVKEMILAITFADDEHFSPLQAADLLANLTNKYWRDSLAEASPKVPELLKRLLTPPAPGKGVAMWHKPEFWNAAEIDTHLAAIVAAKEMPNKL